MSTGLQTAEGVIKVYDHITDSLRDMLPKTYMDDAINYLRTKNIWNYQSCSFGDFCYSCINCK